MGRRSRASGESNRERVYRETAMERVTRNGPSATARIPLPGGKENARPCERGNAVRRKLSFASGESTRQTRVSLGQSLKRDERRNEGGAASERGGHALLAKTLVARKTPFHVHRDASETTENFSRGSAASSTGSTGGKLRARVDESVEERSSAASRIPRPSKIPRRSRSSAVPSAERGGRTRSVSVESTVRTRAERRCRSISGAASSSAISSRARALVGTKRSADAANLVQARGDGGPTTRARSATPVDGAPPPPIPTIPPKAAGRRNKREVVEPGETDRAEAPNGRKESDPFPTELLYHTEYNDDLPLVEREREERSPRLSDRFLSEHVNAEQRRLVVTFLIRLGMHCRYPSFVVYRSVKLFDVAVDRIRVETAFIQLTALASLWIALKKLENFHRIPTATTMIALAKELYLGREDLLIAYERKILRALDFNVTFADAFALYGHHLINCRRHVDVPDETATFLYHCGGYVIDVTLLDEQFCRTSVDLIAATTTELVLGLVLDTAITEIAARAARAKPRWLFWRGLLFAAIPRLAGRFTDKEIDRTRIAMLRRVSISGKKRSGFEIVYKKYSRSKYGRISESFLERANRLCSTETFYDS